MLRSSIANLSYVLPHCTRQLNLSFLAATQPYFAHTSAAVPAVTNQLKCLRLQTTATGPSSRVNVCH